MSLGGAFIPLQLGGPAGIKSLPGTNEVLFSLERERKKESLCLSLDTGAHLLDPLQSRRASETLFLAYLGVKNHQQETNQHFVPSGSQASGANSFASSSAQKQHLLWGLVLMKSNVCCYH